MKTKENRRAECAECLPGLDRASQEAVGVIYETSLAGLKADHIRPKHRKYPCPILFVHGMWGGSWVFHFLMLALASRGYECYALNLRGHHGSRPGTNIGKATVGDYEKDVVAAIEAIDRPVVLIGWSLAGLVCARVAGESLKVKAFYAIAPAPARFVRLGLGVAARMPRYIPRMILGLPVKLTEEHCRHLMFNTSDDMEFLEMNARLVPESGWAALLVSLWRYDVERLPCPSAVVSFKDDNIVRGEEVFARRIGASRHSELPGSHTAFMTERHGAEVVEHVHRFLQECLAEGFQPAR